MENDIIPIAVNSSLLKFFVSYLFEHYESKDLVLKKFKDILISTHILYPSDTRIMQFAVLLGLTKMSFTQEEVFIYAKLLKASRIPLDTIFGNKHDVLIKYEDGCKMLKRYYSKLIIGS